MKEFFTQLDIVYVVLEFIGVGSDKSICILESRPNLLYVIFDLLVVQRIIQLYVLVFRLHCSVKDIIL